MNRTGAGNACIACSTVSFTDSGTDYTTDTSACTATSQTINVAQAVSNGSGSCKQNQTRTGSRNGTRTKTRTCYRTGGAGGTMVRRLVPVRRIVLVILIPAGLIRDALIPAGLTVARRIAVVIAVIAATI